MTKRTSFYYTDEIIVLPYQKQYLAVYGYSVLSSSQNDSSTQNFMSYLDSHFKSYSLHISSNYTRLFLFFNGKDTDTCITNVAQFLEKNTTLFQSNLNLLFSPLNMGVIGKQWNALYNTKLKKTKNNFVTQLGQKYLVLFSINIKVHSLASFTNLIRRISSYSHTIVHLSSITKNENQTKKKTFNRSILISSLCDSFNESTIFLDYIRNEIQNLDRTITGKFTFYPLNDLRKLSLSHTLGFSIDSFSTVNWYESLQIDRVMYSPKKTIQRQNRPIIANFSNEAVKNSKRDCTTTDYLLVKEVSSEIDTSKSFNLEKETTCNPNSKNKISENRKNSKLRAKSLCDYGKVVSNDEMVDLLNSIPPPPGSR